MTETTKHTQLRLRLDWSEMDLFGHINNVAYAKYVQAARVHYWEVCGMSKIFDESKVGPILASTAIQFKKPLHYPGNVIIETNVEFVKTTSFGLHHRLLNDNGELSAEADDVIVWYNFNTNEKKEISDSLRKMMI